MSLQALPRRRVASPPSIPAVSRSTRRFSVAHSVSVAEPVARDSNADSPNIGGAVCGGCCRPMWRRQGRWPVLIAARVADERGRTTAHRAKLAYVYVRQSSLNQVRQHQREHAAAISSWSISTIALGWPHERVQVIDEDLGKSGAVQCGAPRLPEIDRRDRPRQCRRLVVSLDASRLARNNRDWHQLLELCSVFGVLIADGERLYDPRAYHDRLKLLGLSGIMSEAELHQIKLRLHQGERQKAARGELRLPLPAGLAHDRGGTIILNPDEEVQARLNLVFAKFRELPKRAECDGLPAHERDCHCRCDPCSDRHRTTSSGATLIVHGFVAFFRNRPMMGHTFTDVGRRTRANAAAVRLGELSR